MLLSRPIDFNLYARLFQALTREQEAWLRLVVEEASRRHLPLYMVGGFVRDLLLDFPATDFDLVLEGDAISFARSLAGKYGGKVITHNRFGTATWSLDKGTLARLNVPTGEHAKAQMLDLISARSEFYKYPAALPTVRLGTISEDLYRRDFTINTLAIRLDGKHIGELRDDQGGLDDLERGLVRVLHPRSFVDDPTRIFRAVRYEQRYGFEIAPETLALIPESLPLIEKLSGERLRHELDLVLEEANDVSMLARLAKLGILRAVHRQLAWNQSIQKRFEKVQEISPAIRRPLGWMLWMINLSSEAIWHVESRLHFHAALRNEILAASALYSELSSLTGKKPSQYVAFLDKYPLAVMHAVFLVAPRGEVRKNLHDYLETWRHVKPKTTGHTLKKLGLEPGPEYQKILRLLRDAWLDGDVVSEKEENKLLDKYL